MTLKGNSNVKLVLMGVSVRGCAYMHACDVSCRSWMCMFLMRGTFAYQGLNQHYKASEGLCIQGIAALHRCARVCDPDVRASFVGLCKRNIRSASLARQSLSLSLSLSLALSLALSLSLSTP